MDLTKSNTDTFMKKLYVHCIKGNNFSFNVNTNHYTDGGRTHVSFNASLSEQADSSELEISSSKEVVSLSNGLIIPFQDENTSLAVNPLKYVPHELKDLKIALFKMLSIRNRRTYFSDRIAEEIQIDKLNQKPLMYFELKPAKDCDAENFIGMLPKFLLHDLPRHQDCSVIIVKADRNYKDIFLGHNWFALDVKESYIDSCFFYKAI